MELVAAHSDAEILPRYVLNLVGLIENHRRIVGDDAAEVLVLHRQVGEKQMMVHDHHVALMRPLVHFRDEAALELLAALPGAQFPPGVDLQPRRTVFRQGLNLRAVAGFRSLFPVANDLEVGHFFQAGQHGLFLGVVNLLPAGVVAAPLHVANPQRMIEMLLQKRDVFEIQLLLQILRARGDYHPSTGQDSGHQVCERLARSGPGVDHQMPLLRQRRLHRFGHFELTLPELEIRVPTR